MKTKLHYYRFDVSKQNQAKEYDNLCEKLAKLGLKKFDSISLSNEFRWYRETIRPLDGKQITLETKYLFSDQWNTAPVETSKEGLRVFDWAETIYPNLSIKEGQYLEQTKEMEKIRRNTSVCGYCGAQYYAPKGYVFCEKCLDSPYLEENQLHLLRLMPVFMSSPKRKTLSVAEKKHLLPKYRKLQVSGKNSRSAAKNRQQREKIKREYESSIDAAKTKHDGLLWLMDNGVSIDNCIYYSHTDRFCFGWRKPLSDAVKSDLLDILVEFPFDYDLK